tara:strand:+ start:303 stop:569 length:267 start_codon:yes stop_codon:yes gene_type:complete
MTNKHRHRKVNDEIHQVLRGKFMDLTFRVHSICEFDPRLISRLLYELVNDSNQYKENYIPNDEEVIQTLIKIEQMLDELEDLSNESKH